MSITKEVLEIAETLKKKIDNILQFSDIKASKYLNCMCKFKINNLEINIDSIS